MDKEYKSWIDNCMRCGKPMRVTRTGNHYCRKCRQARMSMTGRGYPTKAHYPAKAMAKALGLY